MWTADGNGMRLSGQWSIDQEETVSYPCISKCVTDSIAPWHYPNTDALGRSILTLVRLRLTSQAWTNTSGGAKTWA